ncbi:MAG: signal peptidase II [Candidatus Nanoarchaeia archaeon]
MKLRNILLTISSVVFLDQITKAAFTNKQYLLMGYPIISYTENTGAAFSILEGWKWLLISVAIASLIVLAYYTTRIRETEKVLQINIGMLMGGMIGNLSDRIILGYVRDFINIKYWPTFNIADSAMFISIILLVVYFIKNK